MFSRSAEAADYFTEHDAEKLDDWLDELGKDKVPAHVQEDQDVAEAPRGKSRHRGTHRKPFLHFMRH